MDEALDIEIPVKFSDQVRALPIGKALDITGKERGSTLSHAGIAFPEASFITRKINGKLYLIRTA